MFQNYFMSLVVRAYMLLFTESFSLGGFTWIKSTTLALWVRLFPGLPALCVIFNENYMLRIESLKVLDVNDVIESIHCDMIVLDGFRYEPVHVEIRGEAFASKARKILTVKSMAGESTERQFNTDRIKKSIHLKYTRGHFSNI